MSIPLATTTISVLRNTTPGDQRATPTWSLIATGVRGHIGGDSGVEVVNAGEWEAVTFRLDCDPTDLAHADRVIDDTTGETFEVIWSRQRHGLGLDHTVADLRQTTDRVSIT